MTVPVIPDEDFERFVTHLDEPGRGLIPRDYAAVPYGTMPHSVVFGAAGITLILRAEFADRIRQKDKDRSWPGDMADDAGVPLILQQSTNYCHSFAPVGAAMTMRAIEGKPFVLLSASSVAGPITNYRNVGHYVGAALEQCVKVGIAPASLYRMVTTKNEWTPEAKEAADGFRVTEWIELGGGTKKDMADQVASCLMADNQPSPVAFGLNSMRHAMYFRKMVIVKANPLTFGYEIQNSWPPGAQGFDQNSRAVFSEAKGTPDEAYAIRQGM